MSECEHLSQDSSQVLPYALFKSTYLLLLKIAFKSTATQAAAQRGAASSGRGGGTVAASISRGAMPLKEGFLMRNTLSSTSSTALSGVDAPLVTPAPGEDISL